MEEQYDQLLEESARRADEADGAPHAAHRVGIRFQCGDGTTGLVRLSPGWRTGCAAALPCSNSQAFVQTVVDAVEHPGDRPLCKP